MARFVDLELEEDAPPDTATTTGAAAAHRYLATDGARPGAAGTATDDAAARPDPDRNAVTRALGSYPYVELGPRASWRPLRALWRASLADPCAC